MGICWNFKQWFDLVLVDPGEKYCFRGDNWGCWHCKTFISWPFILPDFSNFHLSSFSIVIKLHVLPCSLVEKCAALVYTAPSFFCKIDSKQTPDYAAVFHVRSNRCDSGFGLAVSVYGFQSSFSERKKNTQKKHAVRLLGDSVNVMIPVQIIINVHSKVFWVSGLF